MPTAESVGRALGRGIGPVAKITPEKAGGVLRRVLELAIDGYGRFPSAKAAAARQLYRASGEVDEAIHGLVDLHVRLASANGFATNLGGLAMLPVMMPANIVGLAILQTRMVAAIAHLRGYDLDDNRVRTALIMCLLGGEQVARRIANGVLPTSPMAVATAPMFDPALDARVAQEVLGDLTARIGGKNLALAVSRRIPLIGGGVGAAVDGIATHQIGVYVQGELLRRRVLQA